MMVTNVSKKFLSQINLGKICKRQNYYSIQNLVTLGVEHTKIAKQIKPRASVSTYTRTVNFALCTLNVLCTL